MDMFEELVMWNLTHNGGVFVCPQFSIDSDWSVPDFVALDFGERCVMVVEVSAAASPRGLLEKARKRDQQWLSKLRVHLRQKRIIDDSWRSFCIVLYIRESAAEKFRREFKDANDVTIRTLEEIAFPWNWHWASAKLEKEAEETGHS